MASNNNNNNNYNSNNETEIDELEEDYYAILNLSKEATEKEITQAYHRFGRIYHPDKHKTEESKRNADVLFSKIKKVYDVLSDPHKRAIYDSVGVKGLKKDGWQIISRTKTPKEIREEYERLAKEEQEKRLKELTNSIGDFSMTINATSLFDRYADTEEMFNFKLTDFSMSQHLDIPLTNNDTSSITVSMDTDNDKRTSGALKASFRRIMSPQTWIEFSPTFGSGKGFELKGFKRLSERCTGTLSGMFTFQRNGIGVSFVPIVNYKLSKNVTGHLIYKSGNRSRMKTIIEYDNNDIHLSAGCQLSILNSYVECEIIKKFKNYDFTLNSSIKYGYLGLIFKYGIGKKITEFSNLNASILVGTRIGVFLQIRLDRATQSFLFPIQLSESILPSAIFYGSFVPLAFYYIINKFIIEPYMKDKEQQETKDKKEKLRSELVEKRRQALAAQELMSEAFARSIEREGTNGLIILNAYYGKLPTQINSINDETENIVKVIIPLQVQVKDHSLQILNDSTKSDLQGFYDPCIGEAKSLYIKYKFNNEIHEVVYDDYDIIRIPKKSHRKLV